MIKDKACHRLCFSRRRKDPWKVYHRVFSKNELKSSSGPGAEHQSDPGKPRLWQTAPLSGKTAGPGFIEEQRSPNSAQHWNGYSSDKLSCDVL